MDYKYYRKFIKDIFKLTGNIYTQKAESVFSLDYPKFHKEGYRLIIFDVDDTLCGFLDGFPSKTKELITSLNRKGFKIAMYSNCPPNREMELNELSEQLGIYNIQGNDKPNPEGYVEAIKYFKLKTEQTIMVGDRIGTDIYGAFQAKIPVRILVKPYSQIYSGSPTPLFYRVIRAIEKALVRK